MVKFFRSTLVPDRYFIYDVESGSLHSVDCSAFYIAKKRYGALEEGEDKYLDISEDDAREISEELSELEQMKVLNTPAEKFNIPFTGEIKAMCLHICHDCNLRCPYCFAHSGTYNTPKDYMTFEVGKNAIDFLISHSKKRRNLEVDFFGGEPLMNFDVVKQIVEYAFKACKEAGKVITFTLTTNGVLLNESARQWLNENMENVVISLDGRKEIHDKLRVTPNGSGSQEITLKNAIEFRKIRGDKKYYIRGTYTSNNLDFARDVLYLNDKGFDQISVEPVILQSGDPLAITEDMIPKIYAEYDKLSKEYVERRKGDKWFNFFHYMIDLKNGPCVIKRLRGCGAGSEYVAVTPIGDIYPCHQFVTDQEYYMGSVMDGTFNGDIQKKFFEVNVYSKDDCNDCIAKYYCSGGCAANSLHFAGSLNKCHKIGCELMRKRLTSSLDIYAYENDN